MQHVRTQISRARDESDQLRSSIDSQLKNAVVREKIQSRNDELINALEESAVSPGRPAVTGFVMQ